MDAGDLKKLLHSSGPDECGGTKMATEKWAEGGQRSKNFSETDSIEVESGHVHGTKIEQACGK